MYIYEISLSSSWKEKYFGRTCTENQNTNFMLCNVRVFENKVLRRIFGPKRAEVTGEWRELRNEELDDVYC